VKPTIRQLVRRMVVEAGVELKAARAYERVCRWKPLEDDDALNRFHKVLRGQANRHFEADAIPDIIELVVASGGEDLVTGRCDAARRDGEYARMQQEPDGLFHSAERERFKPRRVERSLPRRVSALVE
jgi:hypothetical protein